MSRVGALLCCALLLGVAERASAASYVRSDATYEWLTPTSPTVAGNWKNGLGCPDTAGDDSITAPIDLDFGFRFGGAVYTQVRIFTNGRLQFDNTRCTFGTQSVGPPRTYSDPMPDSDLNRTITGYNVDLDVSIRGRIEYGTTGTAPNRVFVASWLDTPQWNTSDTSYRFQIQVHESGDFALMYESADDFTGTSTTSLGPGQLGYQLSTSDFLVASGFPNANTGYRYTAPSAAARFAISHSNSGIYCLDHRIVLTAVNSAGAAVSSYSGKVRLSTSTGRGTWVLVSGAGNLVNAAPDNGLATYTWPAGESTVQLALRYRAGAASVTVDATDEDISAMTDNNTHGAIAFTPDGFTVTTAALPTTHLPPHAQPHAITIPAFTTSQTAGASFPVHLTAFGQTPDDASCGIITTYDGAKNLRFWANRVNPATGTRAPTIDTTSIATTEATSAAQNVVFGQGRAQVTLKYKDVGSLQLAVKDISSGNTLLPNGIRGTSGTFVFRPAAMVVTSLTSPNGLANPAANSVTGPAFVAAGAPFAATVQVRDADGDPTPNFGLETPAEAVRLTAQLALPAMGRNGSANDGAIANGAALPRTGGGIFSSTQLAWDEVGVIRLVPSVADANYLGSGAFTGTTTGNVGRFYPSALVSSTTPVLTSPCSSFVYMNHDALRVAFSLEARNAQGGRTRNFDTALLGLAGAGGPSLVAEHANDGVDRAFRLRNFAAIWSDGRATVDVANVGFTRGTGVDGPFSALRFGIAQRGDPDNLRITGSNMNAASAGDCAVTGSCDALSIGTLDVFYGRAALRPGIAAETAPLDMTLVAQRWNGTAFVTNPQDACTAFAASAASLSTFTGALAAGETSPVGPSTPALLTAGSSTSPRHLRLAAPGAGNAGTVRVTLAVEDFLQFDWTGAGLLANPFATATFGHYRGHDRVVYRREVR